MNARETEALVFERTGPPAEVVTLRSIPLPEMGRADARVALRLSPVNPADLNYIEGVYGLKPALPAVGGLEGVGEVVEAGAEAGIAPGTLVSLPRLDGHWRREWVGPAAALAPFPAGLSVEETGLFRINPCTTWGLLHEFATLKPGDWVVQNAATSQVGRAVIAIARHLGLHTLNLIRHAEDIPALEAEGADRVVILEGADAAAWKREIGAPIRLGLNAVGGESAAWIGKVLAPGSPLVTYGAMGRQPVRVSNAALIFQDLRYVGFWITRWREEAGPARVAAMEEAVAALFRAKVLRPQIGPAYALGQAAEALAAAAAGGPAKTVFRP